MAKAWNGSVSRLSNYSVGIPILWKDFRPVLRLVATNMKNTLSSEGLTCEDVQSNNWGLLQPSNSITAILMWRHFWFKAKLAKLAADTSEPSSKASTEQQCDEGKSSMVELRIRLPDGQVKRVTSVEFLFLIVLNLQIVSNWLEVLTSLCSVMNFRRFR